MSSNKLLQYRRVIFAYINWNFFVLRRFFVDMLRRTTICAVEYIFYSLRCQNSRLISETGFVFVVTLSHLLVIERHEKSAIHSAAAATLAGARLSPTFSFKVSKINKRNKF